MSTSLPDTTPSTPEIVESPSSTIVVHGAAALGPKLSKGKTRTNTPNKAKTMGSWKVEQPEIALILVYAKLEYWALITDNPFGTATDKAVQQVRVPADHP